MKKPTKLKDDMPIEVIGFTNRALNVLVNNGFRTVGEVRKTDIETLKSKSGLGNHTLVEIIGRIGSLTKQYKKNQINYLNDKIKQQKRNIRKSSELIEKFQDEIQKVKLL